MRCPGYYLCISSIASSLLLVSSAGKTHGHPVYKPCCWRYRSAVNAMMECSINRVELGWFQVDQPGLYALPQGSVRVKFDHGLLYSDSTPGITLPQCRKPHPSCIILRGHLSLNRTALACVRWRGLWRKLVLARHLLFGPNQKDRSPLAWSGPIWRKFSMPAVLMYTCTAVEKTKNAQRGCRF